jgi:hypothetical protein
LLSKNIVEPNPSIKKFIYASQQTLVEPEKTKEVKSDLFSRVVQSKVAKNIIISEISPDVNIVTLPIQDVNIKTIVTYPIPDDNIETVTIQDVNIETVSLGGKVLNAQYRNFLSRRQYRCSYYR